MIREYTFSQTSRYTQITEEEMMVSYYGFEAVATRTEYEFVVVYPFATKKPQHIIFNPPVSAV